jgi:hypothetical protein
MEIASRLLLARSPESKKKERDCGGPKENALKSNSNDHVWGANPPPPPPWKVETLST